MSEKLTIMNDIIIAQYKSELGTDRLTRAYVWQDSPNEDDPFGWVFGTPEAVERVQSAYRDLDRLKEERERLQKKIYDLERKVAQAQPASPTPPEDRDATPEEASRLFSRRAIDEMLQRVPTPYFEASLQARQRYQEDIARMQAVRSTYRSPTVGITSRGVVSPSADSW